MRPVELKIQAFGPYAERETIDFTQLVGRSMFVVSGRTGAGKTTIFDAMTFALYGRASGALRNASDFRSQYAQAEMKTEVDFSFTIRGDRYRIVRQPQQPHPKNKTPIPHEAVLYEWEDGWKPVATKVNEVQEQIESILQLSYEQFSQILLLPQNQFRQLLDSNSNEKQQILQSIFKTEAYRAFQERWAERFSSYRKQVEWAVERTRLKLLELEDEAIEDVSTKSIDVIHHWLNERELHLITTAEMAADQKQVHSKTFEQARTELEQARALVSLFQEQQETVQALNQFLKGETERNERHELLRHLEAAATIRPVHDRLLEMEKHVLRMTIEDEASSKKLEQLQQKQSSLSEQQVAIEENKQKILSLQERLRLIDEMLPRMKERAEHVTRREQLTKRAKDLSTFPKEARLQELQERERQFVETLAIEPEERAVDAERYVDRLLYLDKLETKMNELSDQLAACERDGKEVQRQHAIQQELMNKYKQQEQMNMARQLSEALEDGEPCPVCGSRHHDVPQFEEAVEYLDERESAMTRLEELSTRLIEARADYRSLHQQLETVRREFDEGLKDVQVESSLTEEIKKWQTHTNRLQREERTRLENERTLRQLTGEMRQLEEERRNQFEERQRVLAELEATQQKLNALGQTEEATLEGLQTERTERQNLLTALTKKVESFNHDFEIVKKETWKEEERLTLLRQQLVEARGQFDIQRTIWSEQLEAARLTQERYEQLASRIDQRTKMQEDLQREEEEGVRLRHRIQMIEEKLGTVERPDLQSIEMKVNEAKSLYERASEHFISSQDALVRHRQIVSEWHALREETAREEQKLETIKLIAETGKGINPQKMTFETYVQTAFFDQILHAANIHLDQMTSGQFRLERKVETAKGNAKSGLELLVFDAYTGQSRRVQNLSGGEGFKASLSLALGLAEVVQQLSGGVSLETMLIDEGFGTLDAESLDQAIELLMSLQATGRLVGVISHVQELKDRVDARIEVKKSRSGSTIQLIVE
ncbi:MULTISPECIES: SMC family ATPase [unclassified Exiguobacterium]|uniref:SbcC/MukB-like Walker B domain-containing protein n=1 Tax=unclassified Exiguobacterium TaxID=2644629 RepID=UPI001BEA825B|nr:MULTISPECIES: SMC family ATPase [unclassified Exiguobacterium]